MLYTGNPEDGKTNGIPVSENGVMSSPITGRGTESEVLCAARDATNRTITITGGTGILLSADAVSFNSSIQINVINVNTCFLVKITGDSTPGTHANSVTVTYTEAGETVTRVFDVQRIVPFANIPVESVQISLNAKTLSDNFRASTVRQLVPGLTLNDSITGNLLDYHYDFVVDELSQNAGRVNIEGRYSSDKLLYSLINIELNSSDRLGYHDGKPIFPVSAFFNALAEALDLVPRFYCRDFAVKHGTVSYQCTYQQALSALFGWIDLAHIDVNVFIRGNALYCVQRGYETAAIEAGYGRRITLSDAANVKAEPTFVQHKVRTEWQGEVQTASPIKSNDIVDSTPEPFTGTITFGGNSLTYQDGYLTQEQTSTGTSGVYNMTYYTYQTIDDKRYLSKKEFYDGILFTCSKTEYTYEDNNGVLYLTKETAYNNGEYAQIGSSDYTNAEIVTTTHAMVEPGWYGTTTRNETTGDVQTSLGQGGPANSVSQYTVDKANEALDTFTSTIQQLRDKILATLFGTPIVNTNYPVDTYYGLSDIGWLANQTDYLNNKTEETVNLDVVNVNHVIDFTDIITYRGNDYVLQSNSVSLTPAGMNQNITLIRWF